MGSRLHPRLSSWFERGLTVGQFDVPGGRHIILNQYPRLMKQSRLLASAAVETETLHEFLLAINPSIIDVADGSQMGIRQQLAIERDPLPGLRKVFVPLLPAQSHERWFVYTPPLDVMRQSWREMTAGFA